VLNRIILMGRLTREPELRQTPSNIAVCTITLAVDRGYARAGEQRETDFIDVVTWRQTAEFVSKWFHKGQLVAVEGRLQTRKWKDKFDQNRVSVEVVADNVYFAERANDARPQQDYGYAPSMQAPSPAPQYQQPSSDYSSAPRNGFAEIGDDEDVPF